MDSNQDNPRQKTRSERHEEEKNDTNEMKPNTRAERRRLEKEEQKRAKEQKQLQKQEKKKEQKKAQEQENVDQTDSYEKHRTRDKHVDVPEEVEVEEQTNISTEHGEEKQQEEADSRGKKRKGFVPKLKYIVLLFGIIFILALIAYTVILYGGKVIVDEDKLAISPPSTIETTDGEIISYLYDQYRLPVDLEDIPDYVQEAFVMTEDKRFYNHSGIDFRSIVRAVYKDILAGSKVEGGSTITQQLAKNLFLSNDKSWLRKTKEVMIALYLEREFTKEEILEMYLNAIYFGQGQYGIEAAANKYFYKSVGDLTLEEAALMAGIVNAPNGYSPIDHPEKALKRRNLVLERMYEGGAISEEEMEASLQKDIELNLSQRKFNPAYSAYVDMVIKEASDKYGITEEELKTNRYQIVTALNEEAQQVAYDQFQYDGYFPDSAEEKVEGAFVMMEQAKGELVAAIGGREYEYKGFNRAIDMDQPQPGSVMKPLAVYGPALEKEEYNPYMMLPDEKGEWDGKSVKNYNDQYAGSISLYNALVQSKNTTATWVLNDIGIDYADTYLQKMGIEIDKKKDGLSTALGGLTHGLTPIQLVEGYRTFASGGNWTEAHTIKEITNRKGNIVASANPKTEEVFSPQVAWTMTEMLQAVVDSGTGTAGYYPYDLAGKTGTTNENESAWFVGYTPQYVTALWMGYDDPKSLSGGSSYPTELTKKILTELSERQELVQEFTKPDGVQAMQAPIELPEMTDVSSTFVFGGFKILKGKLQWTSNGDDRIVYNVYEVNEGDGENEKIGEVTGGTEFVIDEFLLFRKKSYYVVPYDPIGDRTGEPSNTVEISF